MSELINAIIENDVKKLDKLLKDIDKDKKIEIDLEDFPEKVEVPLVVYASFIGNPDVVRKLKHEGFNDNDEFTSLRFIDGNFKGDLLQFLSLHEGGINSINMDGHSALSYAIRKRQNIKYIEVKKSNSI